MQAHDEHFLVVGTIEDADLAAFGKYSTVPPEIVVVEFLGGWSFEAGDSAPLRVETGHHMFNGPVFARCVHRLKVDQQGVSILRMQFALELRQELDALAKTLRRLLLVKGAPLFPARREILDQP